MPVNVAVLDGGIQRDHPDLNVIGGVNCPGVPKDAWADHDGHGTFVGGAVGAPTTSSARGDTRRCRLFAVRVAQPEGYSRTPT